MRDVKMTISVQKAAIVSWVSKSFPQQRRTIYRVVNTSIYAYIHATPCSRKYKCLNVKNI